MDNKAVTSYRPRPLLLGPGGHYQNPDSHGHDPRRSPGAAQEHRHQNLLLYCGRHGTPEAAFIVANYIPFDHKALDLGVAGKEIGQDRRAHFDVAIPVTYAVVSGSGVTTGELDGKPYTGPVFLAAGPINSGAPAARAGPPSSWPMR